MFVASRKRVGVGSLLCGAILALSSVCLADMVQGPFTFKNETGFKASDLHVDFSGTGGSLSNVNVTSMPAPATSAASLSRVNLDWNNPVISHGQSVSFTVESAFTPINPESLVWTRAGSDLVFWPINDTPKVAQNYGNFPSGGLHVGLDIPAPKDAPVRAAAASTIVAVSGNFVMTSDGTNLYNYVHVKKTKGDHGNDFTPADRGTTLTAGQSFAFVTGTGNPDGGSFDHTHFEFLPNRGTDALIKNADGSFKGSNVIFNDSRPFSVNPLFQFFPEKDPNGKAPTIGPIFYQPKGGNVAGYVEFGQPPDRPGVRKGTFINGQVDLIQEIRDNQGSEPFAGKRMDPIDNTVEIYNGVMSNPFKVSYQVAGQGVVARHDIAERQLITYNGRFGVQNPIVVGQEVHDARRDTTTANTEHRNFMYILTNTDGTNPKKDNVWNTIAKAGGGGSADGTGRPAAPNNAEGLFPDGIYEVRGFGFDIANNGDPANKTSVPYMVRLNNWKQTAVPTKGGPTPPDVKRADDRFQKDGPEVSFAEFLEAFNLDEDVFGTGDNYMEGLSYPWFIFSHRQLGWEQDDPFSNPLVFGFTQISDSIGHIPDTFLTHASFLGLGDFDLIFDYDFNGLFSWTLDGLGAFQVASASVPESPALVLVSIGAFGLFAYCWRRST